MQFVTSQNQLNERPNGAIEEHFCILNNVAVTVSL